MLFIQLEEKKKNEKNFRDHDRSMLKKHMISAVRDRQNPQSQDNSKEFSKIRKEIAADFVKKFLAFGGKIKENAKKIDRLFASYEKSTSETEKAKEHAVNAKRATERNESLINDLRRERDKNIIDIMCLTAGVNGDVVLDCSPSVPFELSKAELDAAAADTIKRTITLSLKDSNDQLHTWAALAPDLTSNKGTVTDGDVSAPAITGTPVFAGGVCDVELTIDTDGTTKTYEIGESMSVDIKISSDDKFLGYTVAPSTVTINIVA